MAAVDFYHLTLTGPTRFVRFYEKYVWRRRRKLSGLYVSSEKDFEKLIADAIRIRLTELIGPNAAESMNSYLEPNIAAKDPKYYDAQLRSIFGIATGVILGQIENEICERVGMEKRQWSTLDQCLAAAKAQVAAQRTSVHHIQDCAGFLV